MSNPLEILKNAGAPVFPAVSSAEALRELANAGVRSVAKDTADVAKSTLESTAAGGLPDPGLLAGAAGQAAGSCLGKWVCPKNSTLCQEFAATAGWVAGQSTQGFGLSTVTGKAGAIAGKTIGAYACPQDGAKCQMAAEYAGWAIAFGATKVINPLS